MLQSNVSPQDNAAATSSFGAVRNVASAIGVVLGSVIVANKMDAQQAMLFKALGASTANLYSGSNAQANVLLINKLNGAQQAIVRKAFWTPIRNIWIVAVCFSAAGLLVGLLIRRKTLDKTHVEKTGLVGEEERRNIVMEHRDGKRWAGTGESEMMPLDRNGS